MNAQLIDFKPDPPREPHSRTLAAATELAKALEAEGIEIHNVFDNGRRMVLLIDRAPADVTGTKKGRHPNGRGGITERFAAAHGNCQLEWTVDLPGQRAADREVTHVG